MGMLSKSIKTLDYLSVVDVQQETVAFVDAELYFDDGSTELQSSTIIQIASPGAEAYGPSSNIGDALRKRLFDQNPDLVDYHIVETVLPSYNKEFKRRLKERQKMVSGQRLYRSAMSVLIDGHGQPGQTIDMEL